MSAAIPPPPVNAPGPKKGLLDPLWDFLNPSLSPPSFSSSLSFGEARDTRPGYQPDSPELFLCCNTKNTPRCS